jgi:hypothetical protein
MVLMWAVVAGCGKQAVDDPFSAWDAGDAGTTAEPDAGAEGIGQPPAGGTASGSDEGTGEGGSGSASSGGSGASATSGVDSGGVDESSSEGSGDASSGSTEGGADRACARVDVVLAIDDSSSMQEEIEALRGPVFDALPEQLLAVGTGIEDFHLAVVDGCPKPAFFHDHGRVGGGGATRDCDFSTGANWMISSSPALSDEYACVLALSGRGYQNTPDQCVDEGDLKDDDEQPASTAARALSEPAVSAENQGFLREQAVLFVVAITDEDEELIDDGGDPVDPSAVTQAIVAAKGGNAGHVVFLGVGGGRDCDGPYGSALDAPGLRAIASGFESAGRGMFWDLCQGDLEGAFAAAIELVDDACIDFDPQ